MANNQPKTAIEEVYRNMIEDNYDPNSIGRNVNEFADYLANDDVFSEDIYNYVKQNAPNYTKTKAEFAVQMLGSRALPNTAVSPEELEVMLQIPTIDFYANKQNKEISKVLPKHQKSTPLSEADKFNLKTQIGAASQRVEDVQQNKPFKFNNKINPALDVSGKQKVTAIDKVVGKAIAEDRAMAEMTTEIADYLRDNPDFTITQNSGLSESDRIKYRVAADRDNTQAFDKLNKTLGLTPEQRLANMSHEEKLQVYEQIHNIEAAKNIAPEIEALKKKLDDAVEERAEKYAEKLRDTRVWFEDPTISHMRTQAAMPTDYLSPAIQQLKQAQEIITAPDKNSSGWGAFFKGMKDGVDIGDIVTMGLGDLANNLLVKSVVDKYEKDPDSLRDDEQLLLDAIALNTSAQILFTPQVHKRYFAGKGGTESLAFMAQMLATGGIGRGASGALTKAIGKYLIRNTGKIAQRLALKGLGRTAMKAGLGLSNSTVSAAAMTPFMPQTYNNMLEQQTGVVHRTAKNKLGEPMEYDMEVVSKDIPLRNSILDSGIEVFSEMLGGHIGKGFGLAGKGFVKGLNKAIPKLVNSTLYQRVLRAGRFLNTNNELLNKYFAKQGFVEENVEEFAGNALRYITGVSTLDELKEQFSGEGVVNQMLSLAPVSVIGLGANNLNQAKIYYDKYKAEKSLRGTLKGYGLKQNEVDYFVANVMNGTSEEASKSVSDLINKAGGTKNNGMLNDTGLRISRQVVDYIFKSARSEAAKAYTAEQEQRAKEHRNSQVQTIQGLKGHIAFSEKDNKAEEAEHQEIRNAVDDISNETTGKTTVIEQKDGTRLYVVKGNIVTNDDGTIDMSKSDKVLIVKEQQEDGSLKTKEYNITADTDLGTVVEDRAKEDIYEAAIGQRREFARNEAEYPVGSVVVDKSSGATSRVKSVTAEGIVVDTVNERTGERAEALIPIEQAQSLFVTMPATEEGASIDISGDGNHTVTVKSISPDGVVTAAVSDIMNNIEGVEVAYNSVEEFERAIGMQVAEYAKSAENQLVSENNRDLQKTQETGTEKSVSTDEYQEVRGEGREEILDKKGLPFVKASSGKTDFGYITANTGLKPAPIKLSTGDKRSGLQHIEEKHGEQIAKAGFRSVVDFVEYVADNYDTIAEGVDISGYHNGTYLLQARDNHDNTLYIELTNDGGYWNINSGGVFRQGYGKKNKVVWSASEVQRGSKSTTLNTLQSQDKVDNQSDPNRTVSDTTSQDKDTTNSFDTQEDFYASLPHNNKGEIDETQMTAEQKIRYAEYELGDDKAELLGYMQDQSTALEKQIAALSKKEGKNIAERKRLAQMKADKAVFDEYLEKTNSVSEQNTNVESQIQEQSKPTLFEYFNGSISALIDIAKQKGNRFVKKIISPASSDLVSELESKGVRINTDYNHTIDNSAVLHALKQHGTDKEALRGQEKITEADFNKVVDVISNYDKISVNNRANKDYITYEKRQTDGTTLYVEEVRTGRKELAMVTIYKKKNSSFTDEYLNKPVSDTPIATSDLETISEDKGTTNSDNEQITDETLTRAENIDKEYFDDVDVRVHKEGDNGTAPIAYRPTSGSPRYDRGKSASTKDSYKPVPPLVLKTVNRLTDTKLASKVLTGEEFWQRLSDMERAAKYNRMHAKTLQSPLEVRDINGVHKVIDLNNTPELNKYLFQSGDKPNKSLVKEFNNWLKKNADKYVRLYHGTSSNNPIQEQGIKRTTQRNKKSFQSRNGYVYLSRFPDAARLFGEMNNYGDTTVYAVDVKIKDLLPDLDQLNNKRGVGFDVGNTLADSLMYGNGARVKRDVGPYELSPTKFYVDNIKDYERQLQTIKDEAITEGTFMKAPNGERTNLNERQWLQVRTPEFKRWFGDWEKDSENASKVVDDNGEPMVVYHYTDNDFTEFDVGKARRYADVPAFFFTTTPEMGMEYGGKEMPVFLNIRNLTEKPRITSEKDGSILRSELEEQGFDGTIVDDSYEGETIIEYAAFSPTQIKSAVDNVGTFDEFDSDIRYKIGANARATYEAQIRKNNPNISEEHLKEANGYEDFRFLRYPSGTIYGFVDSNNVVYLNSDVLNLNTPIHEFGHLWVSQIRNHFPDVWDKGKELFANSTYLKEVQVDPNYRHLNLDQQIDEAMARAIGDNGEREVSKTLFEKIVDWIADVWKRIGSRFGIENLTAEQISKLTLKDFTDIATSELLSGKDLTARVRTRELIETNERFNSELEKQVKGELPKGHVYKLGMPGDILRSAGLPDLPIELSSTRLNEKSKQDNHPFDLSEVKNLPDAIQNPLAVFRSATRIGSFVVMTEVEHDEKNFVVAIEADRAKGHIRINDIRSIHYRSSNTHFASWLTEGLAEYIDKKRMAEWLSKQRYNSAEVRKLFNHAAKVIKDFENPTFFEGKSDDIRFSIADRAKDVVNKLSDKKRGEPDIIKAINKQVNSIAVRTKETYADQHRAVKVMYDELKKRGINVTDRNNYYMQVTATQSKIETETRKYKEEILFPLIKKLHNITKTIKVTDEEYSEYEAKMKARNSELERNGVQKEKVLSRDEYKFRKIEDYVMLKHGLERNEYMRNQDKQINKRDDYAGIGDIVNSALLQRHKGDMTAASKEQVETFERDLGDKVIGDLWQNINEATEYTLNTEYKSGFITKDTYNKVRSMYKYYVPLRGHDDTTASDIMDYTKPTGSGNGQTPTAKGRTSRAFAPFATIEQMAHRAIANGKRNELNKSIFRLANTDTNGLMYVANVYEDKEGNLLQVELNKDMSPDEVKEACRRFKKDMSERVKAGEVAVPKGRVPSLGLFVSPDEARQHAVRVFDNGRAYDVIINTHVSIPRAINGTNVAPKYYQDNVIGEGIVSITRAMSKNMTSRRPAFVFKNGLRDYRYAVVGIAAREGMLYQKAFHNHLFGRGASESMMDFITGRRTLYGWSVAGKRSSKGTEYDKLLAEFVMNGGRTGISQIMELKKRQKNLTKMVDTGKIDSKSVIDYTFGLVEGASEYMENITRFAAYCTSRQMGRSIERSISDAKELTVNFDRRGAGNKFMSAVFPVTMFANASIQALLNYKRRLIDHTEDGKWNKGQLYAGIGIMVQAMVFRVLNLALSELWGDSEDEYSKLSKWDRQNNVCLLSPHGFVKIPIPQELRLWYKIGDEIMDVANGGRPETAALNMVLAATDLLPTFVENPIPLDDLDRADLGKVAVKNIVSNIAPISPIVETMFNLSFTNSRIYDDNKYGSQKKEVMPEWTKALTWRDGTTKTPDYIVWFAKGLNALTGGDDIKQGAIDINPDKINHIARGYLGGIYDVIGTVMEVASNAISEDDDVEVSDFKTASAFFVPKSKYRLGDQILYDRFQSELKGAKERVAIADNLYNADRADEVDENKYALDRAYLDIEPTLKDNRIKADKTKDAKIKEALYEFSDKLMRAVRDLQHIDTDGKTPEELHERIGVELDKVYNEYDYLIDTEEVEMP